MLGKIADFYEDEVDAAIPSTSTFTIVSRDDYRRGQRRRR